MKFLIFLLLFPSIASASIFDNVNDIRIQNNLKPYKYDSRLAYAAAYKGIDMLTNNYFSHTTLEGNNVNYFLNQSSYPKGKCIVGENLARGFTSVEGAVEGWMNSETHKSLILHSQLTHSGSAVIKGRINGKDYYYFVQLFGNCI